MTLQDKVNITNLSEDNIQILEAVMRKYLESKNNQLTEKDLSDDTEEANAILREIWKRLK